MQKVYSANQVATILGIPYSSVKTCMEKGELPFFVLPGGNQRRILESDFIKFKESLDLPDVLAKGITVEIGQTIVIDVDGHLSTYTVKDANNHKLTLEPFENCYLIPHGGI